MAVLLLHGRHGAYKRINTITNNLIIGGPIYSSLSIVVAGKEKLGTSVCKDWSNVSTTNVVAQVLQTRIF